MSGDTYTQQNLDNAFNYSFKRICQARGGVYYLPKKNRGMQNPMPQCTYTKQGCITRSVWPYDNKGNEKKNLTKDDIYTEWVLDRSAVGGGRCLAGYKAIRAWCEVPSSRKLTSGECMLPGMCDTNEVFPYNRDTQTCSITSNYCKTKGLSFRNGECYLPTGQKLAELVFSSTIIRDLKQGRGPPVGKTIGAITDWIGKKLSDQRLKTDIRPLVQDYIGPGINLYLFEWTDTAIKLYGAPLGKTQMGFIAQEVEKIYPDVVGTDSNGYKYIILDQERCITNPFYKRLCRILANSKEILEMSGLENKQLAQEIAMNKRFQERYRYDSYQL